MAKLKFSTFLSREKFIDHLIQAVLIFTSVFLAFWLTDLRDEQKTNAVVRVTLENIASEMNHNHGRIVSTYLYHIEMLKQIDSLRTNSPNEFNSNYGYQLKNWRGVQIPMLRSSSFQILLNSGVVEDIPFEILKAISNIYNTQSAVEKLDNSLFETVLNEKGFTSLQDVRHVFGLYAEIQPDILTAYTVLGKKHLENYGYNSVIDDKNLKDLVSSKEKYFNEYLKHIYE